MTLIQRIQQHQRSTLLDPAEKGGFISYRLDTLRPHMIDSDIDALADVLRDVRARMGRKF